MINVGLIHCLVDKSLVFLILFLVDVVLSIRIGHISNTIFVGSAMGQPFLNITCNECSCLALKGSGIGWNCIPKNFICQLIQNYSTSDIGVIPTNDTTFFFFKVPSKSVLTTMVSPTMVSTTPITSSMKRTTHTFAMTSTSAPTTTTTTSLPCSTSGRGNVASLHSNASFSWTQRSYNHTATKTTATIIFGVNGLDQLCIFLDDISVVDLNNPSIQLLNNPDFENSSTILTGWNIWCSSTCKNGTGGRLASGSDCRSSAQCYRGQCSSPGGVDFLVQTFPTTLNHKYNISFWYQQVELSSPSTSLYLYLDII